MHEFKKIFGHSLDQERELILTLIPAESAALVLESLVATADLHKPGRGIAFVVDVPRVAGVVHHKPESTKGCAPVQNEEPRFVLIVTIVSKGFADTIVDISKTAGAEGGTIVYGRGAGIHEQAKFCGIPIEPEKEMVLTLVPREKGERVLEAILEKGELCKPGRGIVFTLDVEKTAGINHPVC
jgi:nitrogen regulatory protein PII